MKENFSAALKRYVFPALPGLVFAGYLFFSRGGSALAGDSSALFGLLCDAFFVPAALYLAAAAIAFVSSEGIFDALTYGFKQLIHLRRLKPFVPPTTKESSANEKHASDASKQEKPSAETQSYFEYHTRKQASRKFSAWNLLFIGCAFFLPALVFAFLT